MQVSQSSRMHECPAKLGLSDTAVVTNKPTATSLLCACVCVCVCVCRRVCARACVSVYACVCDKLEGSKSLILPHPKLTDFHSYQYSMHHILMEQSYQRTSWSMPGLERATLIVNVEESW